MSPAVSRRLAEEVMTPEKDPWNRPRRNLKLVAERRGSGLRLWAILVAGVVGLVVLLVWAFPQRALGQADWVRLVELGAFFALCASGVVYWRRAPTGRAACRERGWPYVVHLGVAGS